MKLEQAIQQNHFKDEWLRVAANLYYTQSQLQYAIHSCLKPFGISVQQFNILRILRGKQMQPLTVSEVTDRMIDKMSNASRLIEKLRKKDLVIRTGCSEDRRRVHIKITDRGLALLVDASTVLEAQISNQLSDLSQSEAASLNHLLDKINASH